MQYALTSRGIPFPFLKFLEDVTAEDMFSQKIKILEEGLRSVPNLNEFPYSGPGNVYLSLNIVRVSL